ncbi:hypothetical protein DNTS_033466 [Danionella cerebrum]|uniref:Uncharacterized protein n=1 Tax=Danionella cerebrum TaxID=2873325 RepID=A0A553R248_9TELE|nr:hypothetical protein DNTS_033466 [Danionella translucida]
MTKTTDNICQTQPGSDDVEESKLRYCHLLFQYREN